MTRFIDLSGQRFGMLTVQQCAPSESRTYWKCRCDCGNGKIVESGNLKSGHTASCGCKTLKHGHGSPKWRSPEFRSWSAMRERCNCPTARGYADYGGRGITICARWRDFKKFLQDMGPRPSAAHTIDRKNTNGNYDPDNCHWATPKQQIRNRRITVFVPSGRSDAPLGQVCEERGVKYDLVRGRLQRGWPLDRSLSTPVSQTWSRKRDARAYAKEGKSHG